MRLYAEHSWYSAIPPGEIPVYVSWPITPNVAIAAAVLVVAFVFRRSVSTPVKLLAGASLASLAVMIAMGVAFPMLTYRYLIPVVPGILLALAVFVRPVAWPPIVALLCLALPGAQAQTKRLEKRAWFGLEVPVREVPQSARTVSWFMNYDGAQVLDPEQMKRLIADAFARNGRQVEPRWGLVDSDATIILDEKNYRRPGCKIHDQGRASILICPRMRQTYVSE